MFKQSNTDSIVLNDSLVIQYKQFHVTRKYKFNKNNLTFGNPNYSFEGDPLVTVAKILLPIFHTQSSFFLSRTAT